MGRTDGKLVTAALGLLWTALRRLFLVTRIGVLALGTGVAAGLLLACMIGCAAYVLKVDLAEWMIAVGGTIGVALTVIDIRLRWATARRNKQW